MPWDKKKYPIGWKIFSDKIRFGRANARCECTGECDLHPANPKARRCIESHGSKALYAAGRIILTVAHLCDCDPLCAIETHVKACCQRCHLRIDTEMHQKNAKETREGKSGQLKFNL